MSRKHNIDDINLTVLGVEFYDGGIQITWVSKIGFGVYTIGIEPDHIQEVQLLDDDQTVSLTKCYIDSETMDSKDDKEFGKRLMALVLDGIEKVC